MTSQPNFINCPWCTSRTPNTALNCQKCGGPLPAPVGSDPGPTPPPPPRKVPSEYKRKLLLTQSALNLVGGIFFLVGLFILFLFPGLGLATGLILMVIIGGSIGGLFTLLGGIFLAIGLQAGFSKIRPFEHGVATRGEVIEIHKDYTQSINGRNPWKVVYKYTVMGHPYEGSARSYGYAVEQHEPGNIVHVLYMPENPEESTIYPPVA